MKKENYEYAGELIKSINGIEEILKYKFPPFISHKKGNNIFPLVKDNFDIVNLNGAGICLADSFAFEINGVLEKYKQKLEQELDKL